MADIVLGRNLSAEQDSVSVGNLLPNTPWTSLRIVAYTANNDPAIIEYYNCPLTGPVVATVTITYDAQNRITSVETS